MLVSILKVFSLLFLFSIVGFTESKLRVNITQGELEGKLWTSRKGRNFVGFTGIPYAKPPINELRFKPPVKLKNWDGILNATEPQPACPQVYIYEGEGVAITGNEDCLYLNVYTPKIPPKYSKKPKFSVLFYIHGGSFTYNSASDVWLGPEILLDKDIVLVTPNYRLGPLGFLTTGDDVISGNGGLKDLHMALEWVRENIIYFGGSPNKITLVGNSAGSICAQYLLISPKSKNLMQSVILQSGPIVSAFALATREEAINNTYRLATYLNCTTTTTTKLVKCLQNANAADIFSQLNKFMYYSVDISSSPFRPMVELKSPDAFITEYPSDLLRSNKVPDIPIIIGMVAQEGAYASAAITVNPLFVKEMNENFEYIVSKEFNITHNVENVTKAIKKFYFNDEEITGASKTQLTDMYTDGGLLWQTEYVIQAHLAFRKSPIYVYLFDYVGSMSFSYLYDHSEYNYGVCHTDELFYLLSRNTSFPFYVPTKSDEKVSDVMTTLWTNFVNFGNPTPKASKNIQVWKPVRTKKIEHYHIKNSSDMKMKKILLPIRRQFWSLILELDFSKW